MSLFLCAILVLTIGLSSVDSCAESLNELSKKWNCMQCHSVHKDRIGPSYKSISLHYQNNEDAMVILTNKIRVGGAVIWEKPSMPRQNITTDDARTIAAGILNLRGKPESIASR